LAEVRRCLALTAVTMVAARLELISTFKMVARDGAWGGEEGGRSQRGGRGRREEGNGREVLTERNGGVGRRVEPLSGRAGLVLTSEPWAFCGERL
jgi:hypothetical protein